MKATPIIILIMILLLISMVVKPKDFDFIGMMMLFCSYCICKTIEEKK
jgi:energy-coupling factor transporter transmembrane protein EcfT